MAFFFFCLLLEFVIYKLNNQDQSRNLILLLFGFLLAYLFLVIYLHIFVFLVYLSFFLFKNCRLIFLGFHFDSNLYIVIIVFHDKFSYLLENIGLNKNIVIKISLEYLLFLNKFVYFKIFLWISLNESSLRNLNWKVFYSYYLFWIWIYSIFINYMT